MKIKILEVMVACMLFTQVSASEYSQNPIVSIAATDMNWEKTSEGVAFSALKGDRFVQSYMAMVKLPPGTVSPLHIKSANMYGVVIAGTFLHIAKGGENNSEKRLPPGSYYMIPAGLPHISKCVSETECVTFLYQDGKFDFNVVSSQ